MGHSILADLAYGLYGKAHQNGGFIDGDMSASLPTCVSFNLRKATKDAFQDNRRMMCLQQGG